MITATAENIARAVRNEATMTGYTVEEWSTFPGVFYVESPAHNVYVVNIRPCVEHCSCPAFEKAGICKHFVRCEKDSEIERRAAEVNEREDFARYEV